MGDLILSDFFTTKSQANNFLGSLNTIQEKLYEVDFNLDKTLNEQLGSKCADKFLSLLRDNNVPIGSNMKIIKFFGQVKESIASLPTASLTLAIEPSEEILKSISDWFILNLKKQVLIEYETDKSLIAGAVVNFEGKSLDSSVKSVFEKVCDEAFNVSQVKQMN